MNTHRFSLYLNYIPSILEINISVTEVVINTVGFRTGNSHIFRFWNSEDFIIFIIQQFPVFVKALSILANGTSNKSYL